MTWAEKALEELPFLSPAGRLSMLTIDRKTGTLVTKIVYRGGKVTCCQGKANSKSEEQTKE